MGVKLINNLCINGSFESYVQNIQKDIDIPLKVGMFICDLWKVITCPKNSTYKLLSSGGVEFNGSCSFGDNLILQNIGINNVGYVSGEKQFITAACRVTNKSGSGNADVYIMPKSSNSDTTIDLDQFTSYVAKPEMTEVTTIAKTVNTINNIPTIGPRIIMDFKIGGTYGIRISSFIELSGHVTDEDIDLRNVVTSAVTEIQSINAYVETGVLSSIMSPVYKEGSTYFTDINVNFKNKKIKLFDVVLNLSSAIFRGIKPDKTFNTLSTPIFTFNKNADNSGFVIKCNWGNGSFNYDNVNISNIDWIASI